MTKRKQLDSIYYGDSTRWFIATVVDDQPPYGLEGRVQIRIHGLHSENVNDIPNSDLPWAQVLLPGDQMGTSGYGTVPQLGSGALVFGIFLDGTISQLPLIIGSLPKTEVPSFVQASTTDQLPSAAIDYQYVRAILNDDSSLASYTNFNTKPRTVKQVAAVYGLVAAGYNAIHSAAIVGTLDAVSGMDSQRTIGSSNTLGIAQWDVTNTARWSSFNTFAGVYAPIATVQDFAMQFAWLLHELRTTFSAVSGRLSATTTLDDNVNNGYRRGRMVSRGAVSNVYYGYLDPAARTNTSYLDCLATAESIYTNLYVG